MLETLLALESWEKDKLGFYKLELEGGYEITLEPLIFDNQWYLAIYKEQSLIVPKIVVKIGKE